MTNMQNKIFDFNSFINEVSLEGNKGIPGEAGDNASSWLKKIDTEKSARMADFERENRQDIMRFMQLVGQSQQIQRGHEEELSKLTEEAFRTLFKSLLDDVELDFKLGNDSREVVQETPEEQSNIEMKIENIEDEKILNEIQRRKILRSIQQGKGLTSKAILNLPMFKKGIADILGDAAQEYIQLLNKISNIAQFNDWRLSEQMIKQLLRGGAAGACKIEFEEKEEFGEKEFEVKQQSAEDLLDEIAKGGDLEESDAASDLVQGTGAKIIARGVDMSVLIHEAIKGIYMLPLQLSLEHLSEEEAELVIANTDTLLDEAQEFKYGPEMQRAFYKAISANPEVKERLDNFRRTLDTDEAWDEMGAFEEQLFWMIFGLLSTAHQEDATDMLKIVYAVLIEDQEDIEELFYPIVEEAIRNLDAEEEYQSAQSRETEPRYSEPVSSEEPQEEPEIELPARKNLSPDEVNDAIIDAYERGDMEEVARLRREYLGEALTLSYRAWVILNS
jgi:hypothetical protein